MRRHDCALNETVAINHCIIPALTHDIADENHYFKNKNMTQCEEQFLQNATESNKPANWGRGFRCNMQMPWTHEPDSDVGEGQEVIEASVVVGAVKRLEIDASPDEKLKSFSCDAKHHVTSSVRQLATVTLQSAKQHGVAQTSCDWPVHDDRLWIMHILLNRHMATKINDNIHLVIHDSVSELYSKRT